jgi:hypothetical protein
MEENELSEIEKLEQLLQKKRSVWSTEILNVIQLARENMSVSDAQTLGLSYRHRLHDDATDFTIRVARLNEQLSKVRKNRYMHYMQPTDIDFRIKTGSDKDILIRSDVSELQRKIDIINAHIAWLKEAVNTMDKLGYAIKNKIEFNNQGIK